MAEALRNTYVVPHIREGVRSVVALLNAVGNLRILLKVGMGDKEEAKLENYLK